MERDDAIDALQEKIKALNETVWERRVMLPNVQAWLEQFSHDPDVSKDEQLQMLFLLSNFHYFGQKEIRELLKSVYRDLFRSRLIGQIRRDNANTVDRNLIARHLGAELKATRFLGMGNPSESGTHLLYYFRQENSLPKNLFINTHQVFGRGTGAAGATTLSVRDTSIKHYVFIDDLCGSGTQAKDYSADIVEPLKSLKDDVKTYYLPLFATADGLKTVRDLNRFDVVEAVTELDTSFKCFGDNSRYFANENQVYSKDRSKDIGRNYGVKLWSDHPLGFEDGQLLLGFNHNTPDNTLPIFWCGEELASSPWKAIFKRYPKAEFV